MKTALLLCLFAIFTGSAHATDKAAAVIAAEKARGAALLHADIPALTSLLSDDLRYVHSTGRVEDKAHALSDLAEKRVAYERFETTDLHAAEIAPQVVVLSGRIDMRKFGSGKWSDIKLFFQSVWREESGAWRMVSMQTASVPKP
jgi:hypothetical protein